jgi:hypothetical protein
MTSLDIVRQRLLNQHLLGVKFDQPEEVVRWLGAVQSQDYAGTKWALAQRMNGVSDAELDQAFADGVILRTHVMRPTWHFVAPEDIRWLLKLTAPRVHGFNAYYYRQRELDDAIFARAHEALIKALEGGKQLTRAELAPALNQVGISTEGEQRFGTILMHAELEGVICSGGRRGKQFTYALLEERVPPARQLERDEAVAELVRRYFTSHGPAQVKDFVWWSGLTTADANAGLDAVKPALERMVVDGKTYWFAPSEQPLEDVSLTAYLMPNYDEYTVAYTDRSDIYRLEDWQAKGVDPYFNLAHTLVIDGQVVGSWKRTFKTKMAIIELSPFTPLSDAEMEAVEVAARRYSEFLEMPVMFA